MWEMSNMYVRGAGGAPSLSVATCEWGSLVGFVCLFCFEIIIIFNSY